MVVEIELKIKQTPEEVEQILLKQNFTVLQKVRTIANYYCNQKFSPKGLDLKEKSVRIRTSINLMKNSKVKEFSVEHSNKDLDTILNTNLSIFKLTNFKTKKLEHKLLKNNLELILTDDKTDYVYLHPNYKENKIAFQIQNIKNVGIIVAYDNQLYHHLPENIQREKLINDVKEFGIKIKSEKQVERYYEILKNPTKLTIKQIIKTAKCKI